MSVTRFLPSSALPSQLFRFPSGYWLIRGTYVYYLSLATMCMSCIHIRNWTNFEILQSVSSPNISVSQAWSLITYWTVWDFLKEVSRVRPCVRPCVVRCIISNQSNITIYTYMYKPHIKLVCILICTFTSAFHEVKYNNYTRHIACIYSQCMFCLEFGTGLLHVCLCGS